MSKRWSESVVVIILAIATVLASDIAYSGESTSKILVLFKERDPDHAGLINIFTQHLAEAGYAYETADIERLLDDPIEDQHLADQDWSNDEALPPMPRETIVMGDFNSEPESDEYERML